MGTYSINDPTSFKNVLAAIQDKLQTKVEAVDTNVQKAVLDVALDCSQRASDLAPIEAGDLRGANYVTINGDIKERGPAAEDEHIVNSPVPGGEDTEVNATVGFALPYANRQHEDISLRHDRTDGYTIKSGKNAGKTVNLVRGGQAKYLETVVLENADKWQQHIKDAAVEGLRKE